MISYATLDDIKTEAANPQEPTDATALASYNRNLLKFGIRATEIIDHLKHFTFAPVIDTRYSNVLDDLVEPYKLYFDYPLLSLTSVTLADSTSLTVNTDVRAYPRHAYPLRWLQMLATTNVFNTTSTDLVDEVAVTGIWGYHSDYDNAWLNSGDTVKTTALTTTTTSIAVNDADGAGGDTLIPRFSEGNLIRIDSEYMVITAISANTLTVRRAVRGSTAATHDVGKQIDVFIADDAIRHAAAKIAVFNYARRGQTQRVTFDAVRQARAVHEIPPEAIEILDNYQIVQIAGI